jgi:hypothetical protein
MNPIIAGGGRGKIIFTPEFILSLFSLGGTYQVVSDGIPEDAVATGCGYNPDEDSFWVEVASLSIPMGERVELRPTIKRVAPPSGGAAEIAAITLNNALVADPACIKAMFNRRFACNGEMESVGLFRIEEDGQKSLGIIGLLNSVLNAIDPAKRLCVAVNSETRDVVGFGAIPTEEITKSLAVSPKPAGTSTRIGPVGAPPVPASSDGPSPSHPSQKDQS